MFAQNMTMYRDPAQCSVPFGGIERQKNIGRKFLFFATLAKISNTKNRFCFFKLMLPRKRLNLLLFIGNKFNIFPRPKKRSKTFLVFPFLQHGEDIELHFATGPGF